MTSQLEPWVGWASLGDPRPGESSLLLWRERGRVLLCPSGRAKLVRCLHAGGPADASCLDCLARWMSGSSSLLSQQTEKDQQNYQVYGPTAKLVIVLLNYSESMSMEPSAYPMGGEVTLPLFRVGEHSFPAISSSLAEPGARSLSLIGGWDQPPSPLVTWQEDSWPQKVERNGGVLHPTCHSWRQSYLPSWW